MQPILNAGRASRQIHLPDPTRARKLVLRHAELQRDWTPLQDVVRLRPAFSAEHTAALPESREAETRLSHLNEDLCRLTDEIDRITVDERALAVADKVNLIAVEHKNFKRRSLDILEDEQVLRLKLGEAKQALRGLGLPLDDIEQHTERLRLNDRQKKLLRKLASDRVKLLGTLAEAENASLRTENDYQNLVQRPEEDSLAPQTDALASAIDEATSSGDLEAQLRTREMEISELTIGIEVDCRKLGCRWNTEEILARTVPTLETIDHFRQRFDDFAVERKEQRSRRQELEGELDRGRLELAGLARSSTFPMPEELSVARTRRDRGWDLIRRDLLKEERDDAAAVEYTGAGPALEDVARVYESFVASSDDLADRLLAEADRVRARLEIEGRRQATCTQLERNEEAAQQTKAAEEALQSEWQVLWLEAVVATRSPREMSAWRRDWDALRERISLLKRKVLERERQEKEIAEWVDRLRRSLLAVGEDPAPHAALTRFAETRAFALRVRRRREQAATDRKLQHQQVESTNSALKAARVHLEAKRKELKAWEVEWQAATSALEKAGLVGIQADQLEDVLTSIDDFFKQMNFRHSQANKMEKSRAAQKQWEADFIDLVSQLDDGRTLEPPIDYERSISAWVSRVKAAEASRDLLQDRRASQARLLETRPEVEAARGKAGETLARLVQEARAERADELPRRIELADQQREIERRIEAEYREPMRELAAGAGCSVEEIERQAAGAVGRDLELEATNLEQDLAELELRKEQALRDVVEAETRLKEMLDRVGSIVERERLEAALTRIRLLVPEYATLVLAEAVLARAIERYRERNKSDLFESASRFFRRLTCDRFMGLELDRNDKDEQILLGVRPDDVTPERVPVEGMSDGTRDQLYLALRLAHLEKYTSGHGPFPIIVDDILLCFDDDRAKAALHCLSELSLKTQILFFTHHRHLRDMASTPEFAERIGVLELKGQGVSVA